MSAQRASAPVRLARAAAAVVLTALAAVVIVRLAGRRETPAPPPVPPPPEGRVDVKERVRHEEYEAGRLVADIQGDTFFRGPDGRNHLKGSVEIVDYGSGGEKVSRLTADEVVYEPGSLRFNVRGGVRVEAGDVLLEGDSFDYDKTAGLFETKGGGRFASKTFSGLAPEISYRESADEVRLGGGFLLEMTAAGGTAKSLSVSGESLTYSRRERRGRVEGKARLDGDGFKASAATASLFTSEDDSGLASAVLDGGAEVLIDGKPPQGDPGLEAWADRIIVGFSRDLSAVGLQASGRARFDIPSAPDRSMTVMAPSALMKYFRDDGRLSGSAWGGVRAETAEGGLRRVLEGEEALFLETGGFSVYGGKGRPAVAESADFRIEAPDIRISPNMIHFSSRVSATTRVSGVLKGQEGGRIAGLFSSGEDVGFSCFGLVIIHPISTFRFTDVVLTRQEKAVVRAGTLDVAGEEGRMDGGGVEITLAAAHKSGTPARTVVLGGKEMAYHPDTAVLTLSKEAFIKLPEARLEAGSVSAVIGREDRGVESLAAAGGVVVTKGAYTGRAEAAAYDAAADRITLTGHPVLTDREGGSARGDKLTFDLADDKILVENEGTGRSTTIIRS